jgi:hypothetical protein
MKKYYLALRHFIPHLIAVAVVAVVAVFFSVPVIGGILITAFFTLLLPYMEKVREIERQFEDREAQRDVDISENVTSGRRSGQVQNRSPAKTPEPLLTRPTESEVKARAIRLSVIMPGLKALAFILGGLAIVGVLGYAVIYLLLYFFFYP